jgi:hypothetical protein
MLTAKVRRTSSRLLRFLSLLLCPMAAWLTMRLRRCEALASWPRRPGLCECGPYRKARMTLWVFSLATHVIDTHANVT